MAEQYIDTLIHFNTKQAATGSVYFFNHRDVWQGKQLKLLPTFLVFLSKLILLKVIILGDLEGQRQKRDVFEVQERERRGIFPKTRKEKQNGWIFQLIHVSCWVAELL